MEDNKLLNFTSTDAVIEECNDATEEANQIGIKSLDCIQLLPMEKRFTLSSHSGNNTVSTFNRELDRGSIYTTPSMFSLISMPSDSEDNMNNMVTS